MSSVTRRLLALAVLWLPPSTAGAEWQVKPFVGIAFGGATTLSDLDQAVDSAHAVLGISGLRIGEIVGVEGDLSRTPLFEGSLGNVLSGTVVSLTGNIVVALPRRLTQYTLRPYFVGGGGLLRARSEGSFNVVFVEATLPAIDLGAGATGFLTRHVGVTWEARHFRSIGEHAGTSGISFGPEQLSYWRATAGIAIRFD